MQGVSEGQQHRHSHQLRAENVHYGAFADLRRDHRQCGHLGVAHAPQTAIDHGQGAGRLAPAQPAHGLGYETEHQRQEQRRRRRSELEYHAPVALFQQLRGDLAADDGADGVADGHQRHIEAAAPCVREFRGHGVDRRQHAADAQSREDAPQGQVVYAAGVRRHDHPESHDRQTPEQGAAPSDPVGDAAQQDRADSHAHQFHGQDDSPRQRGRCPSPAQCPGDAKLMASTSKPSSALRPTVIATTAICRRLMGFFAMTSRGSNVTSNARPWAAPTSDRAEPAIAYAPHRRFGQ